MEDNKDLIDKFSKEEDGALFESLDKAQKDLEDLIEENKRLSEIIARKQKEIKMKVNEYETIDILTDLFTYITVGAAVIMIISLLIRAAF